MQRRFFLSAGLAASRLASAGQPLTLEPLIRFGPRDWDSVTLERAQIAAADPKVMNFMSATEMRIAPGVKESMREIEFLLPMQELPINNAKALSDLNAQHADPVTWMLSTVFGSVEHQRERALMDEARTSIEPYLLAAQLKFKRARPGSLDRRVQQLLTAPGRPSFPSEYAAHGYVYGEILATMHPHLSSKCRDAGAVLGVGREVAGLHYRSDTVAGRMMAKTFFDPITEDLNFHD